MSLHFAVLLLGSNINFPQLNIENAIKSIENEVGKVVKLSKMIESNAVEFDSINIFCNIALIIETQHSPIILLKKLKNIEVNMGRIEDSKVLGCYQDRIIDIDIVSYNKLKFISKNLVLPHYKHTCEREFSRNLLSQLEEKYNDTK